MSKFIKIILPSFLISCGGLDVSLVKNNEEKDSGQHGLFDDDNYTDTDADTDAGDTDVDTGADTDAETGSDTAEITYLEGIVGYANFSLRQLACPACMGEASGVTVSFLSKFHNPISGSHMSWMPDPGTCIENLIETTPSTTPVDIGSMLIAQGSVHSFSIPRISAGTYQTTSLYDTQYDRDSVYTVGPSATTDSFEFISLRGFDYIEPVEMLYVDPSYAYAAPIRRTGATFSWGPSGSSSELMIIIAVYTPDGSSLLGYVTCVGPDSGVINVPSTYLSHYPQYSIAAIHISRESVIESPFYLLGGYVESHMSWEVVGTGYIE